MKDLASRFERNVDRTGDHHRRSRVRGGGLLLGKPGCGKSHLPIALGIRAVEAGYRGYFTTATDMVVAMTTAYADGTFTIKIRTYTGPSVLVIDERFQRRPLSGSSSLEGLAPGPALALACVAPPWGGGMTPPHGSASLVAVTWNG